MTRAPAHGGAVLLEVVVALVVFSVGLLGAAGMVTVAGRTLGVAREIEEAGALALEVADSLAFSGVGGSGDREDERGRVTWTVESAAATSRVRIEARSAGRASGVTVVALLPSAGTGS